MSKILNFILSLLGLVPKKKLSPITNGKTQTWYGRVNFWAKDMSLLKKELNALVKAGCSGYMIEMAGWANSTGDMWTDKWIKEIEKKYTDFIEMCRARGLWAFVSVVNDNLGSGKYGDNRQHTIKSEYAKCQKLVQIVKKVGKDNVVIQPVAETQTAAGKQFEQYCIKELGGFKLCYNGAGGHPGGAIGSCQFYAVHPSKCSAANPGNAFVISDHGLIIRELNGGPLVGHGNVAKIKQWKELNAKRGCPVVGYYAFQVQDFDKDAINAMGLK